jgi:phosphonate ABC transporter permease subunit PhnE
MWHTWQRLLTNFFTRFGFLSLSLVYACLVIICLSQLINAGDLSLGRRPLENLLQTATEFSYPSFLDVWFGNPRLEYVSSDGTVLRVEDRRLVEANYLHGLARATWTTFSIATLGSLLAAILALPLGVLTARNLSAPRLLRYIAKAVLDVARSIHTLVFGLVLVGIVGLGPTAGILAIALHSMGTYGKLFSESIETLDIAAIDAARAVGAGPMQIFFNVIWPSVLPQFVSNHLYVWEFNIRDSTILGVIGAGGLGLLISEATSLFQWGRLSTVLIVIVILVSSFDALSRRIRKALA